jgi:Pyridine nucleotide-disulphide oxidoreductase
MPKDKTKAQILILGGGFAGYFAAKRLESTLAKRDHVEVKLVTDVDYLLFTPMLPEVAAGELETGDIAFPFRQSLHAVHVLRAKIDSLDVASQTVTVSIGKPSVTQPSSVQVHQFGPTCRYWSSQRCSGCPGFPLFGSSCVALLADDLSDQAAEFVEKSSSSPSLDRRYDIWPGPRPA